MIAGMVLSNLLYVVGAIVAATVVSGVVWLRHRRPKSLEAGIEMFSRELKALEPERPGAAVRGNTVHGSGGAVRGGGSGQRGPGAGSGTSRRGAASAPRSAGRPDGFVREAGRNEARAPSPHQEHESG
jgi:hypothetical protein